MSPKTSSRISRRQSFKLAALATAPALSPLAAPSAASAAEIVTPDARDQSFNSGWRFYRGDGERFADKDFDDGKWRTLELPHDWSVEDLVPGRTVNSVVRDADTAPLWQEVKAEPPSIGPFSGVAVYRFASTGSAGGASTAYTAGGNGWYRKRFRLPAMPGGARAELVFDGVYMNAEVFLNGVRVGGHPYGYVPFAIDLTPHLDPAGDNVLAVRVANLGQNTRSYSGSGIYRNVRLNVTRATHFEQWGVRVITSAATDAAATIQVHARALGLTPGAVLVARIRDPEGRVVAEQRGPASEDSVLSLQVAHPRLWSPESPTLYRAECELLAGSERMDRMVTTFGMRTLQLDPQNGLRINGRPYKLRGGCVRADNGMLGAAAFDRAEERRVELLKARGFNAVRTAHNPVSTAFLDACDRHGMLVMEEIFDVWSTGKRADDYSLYFKDWWRNDLGAMVRRDLNHPSIIIWSMGNEISEKLTPQGVEEARAFVAELKRLDPTRPNTYAIDSANGGTVVNDRGQPDEVGTQFLDIAGYNYQLATYETQHEHFPNRLIVGTESYPKDLDTTWRLADKRTYLIGDFVWTAMDYLGEPGVAKNALRPPPPGGAGTDPITGIVLFKPGMQIPGEAPGAGLPRADYPWFNAFCGDIDLIGQQKPQSYLRDVIWGVSPLEMVVQRPLPADRVEYGGNYGWSDESRSWTWPEAAGKPLRVRLFTRGDRVQLELNGRQLGDRTLTEADKSVAEFVVPYEPGRLVATAFRAGKRIGRQTLETAGPAKALRISVDRPKIRASRNDLAYATIEVIDAAGRLLPDAVNVIEIGLSGPCELIGLGNANPRGVGSFQQPVAKTWRGRALAILRPTGDSGEVTIEVRAAGLDTATSRITIQSA